MPRLRRSVPATLLLTAAVAVVLLPAAAFANAPNIRWVPGPRTVDLGSNVAEIDLGDSYLFAGADDTRKLMEAMGNTVGESELGMVSPKSDDQDWFILFEYSAEGYVKDDEKDSIDKDAILESYKEGTEEGNKVRKEKGLPGLHVTGWYEEPHYDQASHNLVWALLARNDDGHEVVNYNVRLLGREGYMSVTLVDEPQKLAVSKPQVENVLSGFAYKSGKSYAEFVPGDKVAQYGLTALIAGGAGAAAVKLGLFGALAKMLAKGGKAIVLLVVAVLAGLKRLASSVMGRGEQA
jgi:uncharacterized membrane-anchored protein